MDNPTLKSSGKNHGKADAALLEGLEQELCGDMTEDELNRLVCRLTRMPTALPDERFVEEALQRWRQAGASGTSAAPARLQSTADRMNILKICKVVISHSRHAFLWQGLAFYLAGFFWLRNSTDLPSLFILPIIAAIPFLFGVIGMARWFEQGVLELMMSLRLKFVRYMNASFLLIGAYSLILNTAFTFLLSDGGFDWGLLALHWCIPGIITAAAAIFLCTRMRDFRTLAGSYAALPLISMFFYGESSVRSLLAGLDAGVLGAALAVSLMLFAAALASAARHIRNGGMLVGARA
jgi:hypothetical protein